MATYKIWGEKLIDEGSRDQMNNAISLPIALRGALMPDAHVGYGLPIGGVLACDNAVIPFAVGVDIACRMKISIFDISPARVFGVNDDKLKKSIETNTVFGVGGKFENKKSHNVMDMDWSLHDVTKNLKDKAWSQLGTSGSGNHFCEFGIYKANGNEYLALLTHSGSRGAGAGIANHFSKLAESHHPELEKHLKHLSWLDMNSEDGLAYWYAMNLMGEYASANHACIHDSITADLGYTVLDTIENHHNFAWKEIHDGKEVIVHRKGATPAGKGVRGVIPGSMASPSYVVEGMGNDESLHSSSHGAGRVMSRKKAKANLNWQDAKTILKRNHVELMSAGLDEVPMVYKNINDVMAAQVDLVNIVGTFHPRIVKMAAAGEIPED